MNYTSMKKRKSVSYSKDLEFPIDKVWSVISAPQNLENCHPFVKPIQLLNGMTNIMMFCST